MWEHVNEHLEEGVEEEEEEEFDIERKLKRIIGLLEDQVEVLGDSWNVDVATIKSLTSLVSELRKSIMDYAELKGKIQRGQVVVQIENYQNQLNEVIAFITEEMCDECRRRFIERFEGSME